MWTDDDRKWLYGQMKDRGYDVGSEETFAEDMDYDEDAEWWYEEAKSQGLDVGRDLNEFIGLMRRKQPDAAAASASSGATGSAGSTPAPSTPSPSTPSPALTGDGVQDVLDRQLAAANRRSQSQESLFDRVGSAIGNTVDRIRSQSVPAASAVKDSGPVAAEVNRDADSAPAVPEEGQTADRGRRQSAEGGVVPPVGENSPAWQGIQGKGLFDLNEWNDRQSWFINGKQFDSTAAARMYIEQHPEIRYNFNADGRHFKSFDELVEYQLEKNRAATDDLKQKADETDFGSFDREREATQQLMKAIDRFRQAIKSGNVSNIINLVTGDELKNWEDFRKSRRAEYDKLHYNDAVRSNMDAFFEEQAKAQKEAYRQMEQYSRNAPNSPYAGIARGTQMAKISLTEMDPQKISSDVVKSLDRRGALTNYIIGRMGLKPTEVPSDYNPLGGGGDTLTGAEMNALTMLMYHEHSDMADKIQQDIYDYYKRHDAPDGDLEYILSSAVHDNIWSQIAKALAHRVANDSGLRDQLREMAFGEYGEKAGFWTQAAATAAPFTVDLLTGGFYLPGQAGKAAVGSVVKGLSKEGAKRLVTRGASKAMAKQAAGRATARWIATEHPYWNIALNALGSGVNFMTFEAQNSAIQALGGADVSFSDFLGSMGKGFLLGGAMGFGGGFVGKMGENMRGWRRLAADAAGFGTEVGIFTASDAATQAMNGEDVDWGKSFGRSLAMVTGFKLGGLPFHAKGMIDRYTSPRFDLKFTDVEKESLQIRNRDELQVFIGEMMPVNADGVKEIAPVEKGGAEDKQNVPRSRFDVFMSDNDGSIDTKRKVNYLLTGSPLIQWRGGSPYPYNAWVDENENGTYTMQTFDADGKLNGIAEYTDRSKAEKDFLDTTDLCRYNNINGIRAFCSNAGFDLTIERDAFGRTRDQFGIGEDGVGELEELLSLKKDKEDWTDRDRDILDAYLNNFNIVFGERLAEYQARQAAAAYDGSATYEQTKRAAEIEARRLLTSGGGGDESVGGDDTLNGDLEHESVSAEERARRNFGLLMADTENRRKAAEDAMRGLFGNSLMDFMLGGDSPSGWFDPILLLRQALVSGESEENIGKVVDYVNAWYADRGLRDGLNGAVRSEIEQSNAEIDGMKNRQSGLVRTGVMKTDNRQVYVIDGDVVMLDDGSGIDRGKSSESLIVKDAATGKVEVVDPRDLLSVDAGLDAEGWKEQRRKEIEAGAEGLLGAAGEDGEGAEEPGGPEEPVEPVEPGGPAPLGGGVDGPEELGGGNAVNVGAGVGDVGEAVDADAMPMTGEGEDAEPDFMQTTPERGYRYLYDESGLDADEADAFVDANLAEAKKRLGAETKRKPKMGTSLSKYKREKAAYEDKVKGVQAEVDYWNGVKQAGSERAADAERARQEEERRRLEEAREAERRRQEAELRRRQEAEALGGNAVGPAIRARWDGAEKIEGNADELVLADGTRIGGRYVMVESGAATPSHNAGGGFVKNEGFPVDEQGGTVNDRDYERDRRAQDITREMGRTYDSRALQNVPVVSRDGVVLSGNGRTMAGEIAAADGTDGAYIDYLGKYGGKFGFTPEQVSGMQHPRVVFVPDEPLPYNAETFSRFNAQEMKGQNKTETAVKLGKIVPDDVFNRIIRGINEKESISDFFGDDKASAAAVNELRSAGVINEMQYGEMFDGGRLSGSGRELIENVLIGKAFSGSPDAVRMLTEFPAMRQKVVSALTAIGNNRRLGADYTLENELMQAVDLAYNALKSGAYKYGDRVSDYARQQNLFSFDDGATVADYKNMTVMMLADVLNNREVNKLRNVLEIYNAHSAESAAGQMDMFSDGVRSKEEILKDVFNILGYGTKKEIESERRDAHASVRSRLDGEGPGGPGGGVEGSEPSGSAGSVDTGGAVGPVGESGAEPAPVEAEPVEATEPVEAEPNAVQAALAAAEHETNTEPTEAQKEAGNYKKGHVKIDGYDVTIENPKGSVRRGTDASGKQWEQEMQNTYGYIRGTEGVDGDHIDVFFSDDPSQGDVFVVDQVNRDGSFDEHKVMYGFPDIESARKAYLSNYEDGWQGLGAITPVSKEEFKKWIRSSHRKTKPFAEYSSVKPLGDTQLGDQPTAGYSIEPTTYTNKKGKTSNVWLVKFDNDLTKEQLVAGKELAKEPLPGRKTSKGWWSRDDGGFLMRSEDSAKELAEALSNEEAVQDAQPLSVEDVATVTDQADMKAVDETIKVEQEPQTTPQYDYDREDDVYDKTLTGLRNVLNDRKRGAIPNIKSIENIIRDLRKRAKTIEDGMATAAGETIPQAFDALANLNGKRRAYEQFLSDIRKKMAETERDDALAAHGVKLGDVVMYKGKEATIHDADARQVTLDVGLAPVLYEVTDWENVELPKPSEPTGPSEPTERPEPTEPSEPVSGREEPSGGVPGGETPGAGETGGRKSKSKWVDDEDAARFEELRQRLRKKMGGQLNMGIDPEIFAMGAEMAYMMIKHGLHKFADFAREMIDAVGEEIRPYLKSLYEGARNFPETEDYLDKMTPYDEVRKFDVKNFDKKGPKDLLETAEHVAREDAASKEAETAVRKLKAQRNEGRRDSESAVAAGFGGGKAVGKNNSGNTSPGEKKSVSSQKEPGGLPGGGVGGTQLNLFGEPTGGEDGGKKDVPSVGASASGMKDMFGGVDGAGEPLPGRAVTKGSVKKNKPLTKSKDDGLQRPDELRSEGLPSDGGEGGRRAPAKPGETGEGIGQGNKRPDRRGGREGNEPDRSLQSGLQHLGSESGQLNARNNHGERGKDYAPKGVDGRIAANIAAIELAQKLQSEGRDATRKEMEVLRKFSGWGGLGKAFDEGAFSGDGTAQRLRKLLGDEAYDQAVMSRNSGFYTPAKVIDSLWDIARALGFKGGNVLEGSAGIGNIIGQMPDDLSGRSHIHAVEIDETTGNILSLLYPDAKVEIQGFEQTRIPNGSVALCITNVPFVTGLRVEDTSGDKDLSRKFHDIHDFCIAKNIRKLQEGGIGIFITSNGTLDNSQPLRDWIVSDGGSDVIGAFRMHNETFGGTSVTSDIVVVRKRVNGKKSPLAIDVSSVTGVRMGSYDDPRKNKAVQVPLDYNRYFVEHPEMMGGEMGFGYEHGNSYRPTSKGLFPKKGIDQEARLKAFVEDLKAKAGRASAEPTPAVKSDETGSSDVVYDSLGDGVKEGSMLIDKDGNLCVASYGRAVPLAVNSNKVKGHSKQDCFRSYSAIKDAVKAVLDYQTTHADDEGLAPLLKNLNKVFDDFVNTYGHFHKNPAISFLKNDMDYSSVAALEDAKEYNDANGKRQVVYSKSNVFGQRVVEKESEPHPETVQDGVLASIYKHGRIDIDYISGQLGVDASTVKDEIIRSGLGFENPLSREVEVSYEYLSGNVREKLRQAEENNDHGQYDTNIKALRGVIPMDIPSHLIEFTLGSSWLEPKLYEDYIKDRTDIDVSMRNIGGTWVVKSPDWGLNNEKNRTSGVRSEKFGKVVWGHELIIAALQNKSVRVDRTVKKWDGSKETEVDTDATQACAARIDEIRQDFKDWARDKMQRDPEMSERVEREYNERFNNYVPKTIPDNFVPDYFIGATHAIKLHAHQAKAAIRATTQPVMLAHEVGAGKTFTLITAAMEMRRLGTARKPMIVVQNATVGQFVSSAKFLYPNAKILTLDEKDRSKEGRKSFYAKIKYNDWDIIVIPQSTLDMIPDSPEREMQFVRDKIDEKMRVLEQMREAGAKGGEVSRAEKEIERLQGELAEKSGNAVEKRRARDEKKEAVARQNAGVKAREMLDRSVDDVEDFDDMGIDAILIDEAHEYKHLGFATAMQRGVKGIDPSYSKKSQGVYLKCQSVMERTGGKNVVFATGTPISNTAAEIWTFMRYLMPEDVMKEYGIYYFDDFVRNFGNLSQMLEHTTSGKFKENNRFAGYVNLPELIRIWSGVSDTVLTDEVGGVKEKIPEMEGGKATDIYLPQNRGLRSVMRFVKSELKRYDNMSGKEKKANSHIPLTMYGIAKAAAVDVRLVVDDASDEPDSKTNEAVRQTLRTLDETASYKGTVAIFADNYQNKHSGFNLYEDIRKKLIDAGVPAEQIVVMKAGMNINKKLEIFDKVNAGDIRVIMGSTATLGTGVNIQERLHTLIHLDAPNRPMDYTQRNGRILRQGNIHKEMGKPVRVLRFGVEDSLDVTAYQRLKTKGAIADSVMHGRQLISNSMENRTMDEDEDVFGDTVAQLSGSEYALLKQQAERDVRKLESKERQHQADQTYIHNQIPRLEGQNRASEQLITDSEHALSLIAGRHSDGSITVGLQRFPNVDSMSDFVKDYNKKVNEDAERIRNSYMDGQAKRELTVRAGGFDFKFRTMMTKETERDLGGTLKTVVRRKMTYSCDELGLKDVPVERGQLRNGLVDIMENVLTGKDLRERIDSARASIERNNEQLTQLYARKGRVFELADELREARERLEDYEEKMKEELEAKEAKYAEMDADVEEAANVRLVDEDDESEENLQFSDGEDWEDAPADGKGIALDNLVGQYDYLFSKNYVAELTGNEFEKNNERLHERVAAYYNEVCGGRIDRAGIGTILLDERGAKDSIAHGIDRLKASAFAAVPGIVSKGAVIGVDENWKGRGYSSITFAAPVSVNGVPYIGIVVANELKNHPKGSHRFYIHGVVLQKNLQSEEFKTGIVTGSKLGGIAKLLQNIVNAKGNEENISDEDIKTSMREEPAPKVTKKGYAVYVVKKDRDGRVVKMVPKMLSNDPGAPPMTWLNADTGYLKRGEGGAPLQNTLGRGMVSVNGSQSGGTKSNKLSWRPGKHLAAYPNASQFATKTGEIPENVVFFEVEYAADPDLHREYQLSAWEHGMKENGDYDNTLGGIPYIPRDSYYVYRTNGIADGATPMIITGAYKINRALTDAEARKLNEEAGGKWFPRRGGELTAEDLSRMGLDEAGLSRMRDEFDYDKIAEGHDESDEARSLPGYVRRDLDFSNKNLVHAAEENAAVMGKDGIPLERYKDGYLPPEERGDERPSGDSADDVRSAIEETASTFGEDVELIEDVSSIKNSDKRLEQRMRNAKGWFNAKTGKVTIVVPNNRSVEEAVGTVLHEVTGHKGLRELFGDDFDTFLDNIYNNVEADIRERIDRLNRKKGGEKDRRDATEEYMSRLAEDGKEFEELKRRGVWQKIKDWFMDLLRKVGVKLKRPLNDNDLRYIIWRSRERMKERAQRKSGKMGADPLTEARDLAVRDELGIDKASARAERGRSEKGRGVTGSGIKSENVRFSDGGDVGDAESVERELNGYDAGRMTFEDAVTDGLTKLSAKNKDDKRLRVEAIMAIGGNLSKILQGMSAQREYDRKTVDDIVRLARTVIGNGMFRGFSPYEVGRLLGMVKRAAGREDITKQADEVVDLLMDRQLKELSGLLDKQLSVRGKKVDGRGVEIQGALDAEGQRMMDALRVGMKLEADDLDARIDDCLDRMGSDDDVTRHNAEQEYAGLMLANEYREKIGGSESEEENLRNEIRQADDERRQKKASGDKDADRDFREFKRETERAIRENKLQRMAAYGEFITKLGGELAESAGRAKDWLEQEQQRVREIQHNANSDLEGKSASEFSRETWRQRAANWAPVRFFMKPLGTFDTMLRFFGSKSVDGRGYLWNRFMTGWVEANDKEWRNLRAAHDVLDAKVSEVFGKKMRWSDLFSLERKMDGMEVEFWDAGEKKTHKLSQGNMLYIYMVNKMSDGRMKLRKMGISEEDVERITDRIDPRFIELADWMQEDFLKQKRKDYNAVHLRLTGADMADIENYFPLKVNKRSLNKDEDLGSGEVEAKPSTKSVSWIKRTKNSRPLDIVNADAFDVILEHLQDNEHIAAFAELNRDLNTLLSYRRFRNKVLNMSSLRFGSGKSLWNNFRRVCEIAAGVYTPKVDRDSVDTTIVNIAKGVTMGKISFRIYTAFKQLTSSPAFTTEASAGAIAKNNPLTGGWQAWNWAMKNLPGFSKRWQSRQAGDSRLIDTDSDWKLWHKKFVRTMSRYGMTPNALIDALTVACGAKAIYDTKVKRYKKMGYDDARAHKLALRDASISVNETQQSSEEAYLSAVQLDRTVASTAITVFRNASMGYQRRYMDAMANFGRKFRPGYRDESIAFMKKQLMRDGLSEEQADAAAKSAYRRSWWKDVANMAVFGHIMQIAWNIAPYLPFLFLIGGDDDKKKEMAEDALLHSLAGPIEGLSFGAQMSEIFNMVRSGNANKQGLKNYQFNLLPLMSDLQTMMRHFTSDQVQGWNDVVNLVVQSGVGVNPQTITDMVGAILDRCDGDPDLSREAAIMWLRIINAPQTQLDQIYLEELGLKGSEAKKLSAGELAERYVRYKMRRTTPLTGWAYSDEARQKAEDRYMDRFVKLMDERIEGLDEEQMQQNFDGGDALLRKEIGKRYAKQQGTQDYGGSPKTTYGEIYNRHRNYFDLAEDVLLQTEAKKAKDSGDTERYKEIDSGRKSLTKLKKDLDGAPYTLQDGRVISVDDIMNEIREERLLLLEELGL